MRRGTMFATLTLSLVATAAGQGGSESYSQEQGPEINLRKCTAPGSCKTEKKKLTMDANWRWVHVQGDYKNCYKGNLWVEEYCPKDAGKECAQKCQLEGITSDQYKGTYGVEAITNGVSMNFVNKHEYGVSVGSRLYMYENEKYEMFYMLNQEFAFDAEMNALECGMNGAVYFIEMQENGGKGIGNNKAGPKFGTGYCDAQCPHDMKFIDGEANIKNWKPNEKDKSGNMGTGQYGACCNEMDIWEANARSQALTPHPCSVPSLYRCDTAKDEGEECGDNDKGKRYKGVCDKDGCDFASWRMGNRKFYGKGPEFTINTEKLLTQVTQFVTRDGSDKGELVEIRRVWVQDGKVIQNTDAPHMTGTFEEPSFVEVNTTTGGRRRKGGGSEGFPKEGCAGHGNSLNDAICKSQNERFGDYNHFQFHGGHKVMGESLGRGHVLAISLWDDVDVSMMWLDSWFPRDKDKSTPGISRGPCEGGETSTPTYVRQKYSDSKVKYTNFAVGCLGCTTPGVDKGPPARKGKDIDYKKTLCNKKPCEDGDKSGIPPECPTGISSTAPTPAPKPETRRRAAPPPETRRRAGKSSRRRRSTRRRRNQTRRRRSQTRRRRNSKRRRR